MNNSLNYDTVWLDSIDKVVKFIDQTKLPNEIIIKETDALQEMYDAIKKLEVRGAPAIGVFAALSMSVLARKIDSEKVSEFVEKFKADLDYLNSSRPTAVNLSWALNCMEIELEKQLKDLMGLDIKMACHSSLTFSAEEKLEVLSALESRAVAIWEEDIDVCKRIGENGMQFIKNGDGILTHCNAGRLATVRFGTATAPMYLAHENGMDIHVYCDETRPLLQGARLTAFELQEAGINTTLQCDNMVSALMREGKINAVFVGCDRVAANGDVANKIGTSGVAIIAKHYNVPFYVCAPCSTIDINCKTGNDIIIEQRNSSEVTEMWYNMPMSHRDVDVYNPAFDVTDHELITGIITENGVVSSDFEHELVRLKESK